MNQKRLSLNINGFDIYELQLDIWVIHVKDSNIYYGTFAEVVVYSITRLGFSSDQLELAVQEMVKYDNNAAHFGMNRSFIFTFNKGFSDVKIAS